MDFIHHDMDSAEVQRVKAEHRMNLARKQCRQRELEIKERNEGRVQKRQRVTEQNQNYQRLAVGEREEHQRVAAGEREECQRVGVREREEHQRVAAEEREECQRAGVTEREEHQRVAAEQREECQRAGVREREEHQRVAAEQREECQRVAVREREEHQKRIAAEEREECQKVAVREREEQQKLEARRRRDVEERKSRKDEERSNKALERKQQRRQRRVENTIEADSHQRQQEHQASLHPEANTTAGKKRRRGPKVGNYFSDSNFHISSCLEEEYPKFVRATRAFPPEIAPENLRQRYNDYQMHINWCADRSPCGICGVSFQSDSIKQISLEDLKSQGNIHTFDACAVKGSAVGICSRCITGGVSTKLKFSSANWINTTNCQHPPSFFDELTLVELNVIARSHLIGYIIRLSTTSKSGISYRGARGHVVAFKQDPTLLLKLLLSPEVQPHHNITVSWDGAAEPTDANLRKFCTVRRQKVLDALEWLKENNEVYHDVKINYDLLQSWPDDAIPPQLLDNAVRTEAGLTDGRQGYSTVRENVSNDVEGDFLDTGVSDEVFENELEEQARDADPGSIVTGAFLQDTEKENESWRERYGNLFAEIELTHRRAKGEEILSLPHIKYRSALGAAPMNSWIDPLYFLAAFPDLFPFGTGGHYQPNKDLRPTPVSLDEFAKWAMTHHSHRFARHPIFPYVLYDMILLRQTAIGNSLQAKKGYWERAQADILAVSSDDLMAAALRMKNGQKADEPRVERLLNSMRLISSYNPESYGRKIAKRHLLFGHIIRFGIPAIWFTINPNDLRNPIVLRIAGVYILPQLSRTELNHLRRIHAIGNPTIVAQYFHFVIESFFKKLLCTDSGCIGILGEISNHFGVVESNSRHMLHLHGFAWVTGNMDFTRLQEQVLSNMDFRNRMTTYLRSIVCEMADELAGDQYRRDHPHIDDFLDDPNDSTEVFMEKMYDDSNYIACRCQIHHHTFTCYKYSRASKGSGSKGYCRFLFPKETRESGVDEDTGNISIQRNHEWVNKHNKIMACAFRSNHDITFIASTSRMLASHYMSNYATKDDVKVHQLVMTAAMLKASLDKAAMAQGNLTASQRRLMDMRPADYAMKIYNLFRKEREIGSVMIASYLIGNPAFYMPNDKYRNLNLFRVRATVRTFALQSRSIIGHPIITSNDEDAETYAKFQPGQEPDSIHMDYIHRGPRLREFCFYEYLSQIGSVSITKAPFDSFAFDSDHPKSSSHRQYSVGLRLGQGEDECDGLWIPAIYGSLTDINNTGKNASDVSDSLLLVQNDIAGTMLGLFVPWHRLLALFQEHASNNTLFPEAHNACALIWSRVEPSLPPHLQRLAQNFTFLRRSKEEAEKDREARQAEIGQSQHLSFDYPEYPQFEDFHAEEENLIPETLSRQDFQHGFMDALEVWAKRNAGLGQFRATTIDLTENASIDFSARALLPVHKPTYMATSTIGSIYNLDQVSKWQEDFTLYVKKLPVATSQDGGDDDDYQPPLDSDELLPTEDSSARQFTPSLQQITLFNENIEDLRLLYQLDPCLKTLLRLITLKFPLTEAQTLSVAHPLNRVLQINLGNRLGFAQRLSDQCLTYIGGQGGTGKTMVIMAFLRGMHILDRLDEVLLTAPTGSAASHIGGTTIHAALGLSSFEDYNNQNQSSMEKIRNRLSNIKILIIDEVSMVGAKMMRNISKKCDAVWSAPTCSDVIMDGLPMVLCLGDFNQFEPVRDSALWKIEESPSQNSVVVKGQNIWKKFTNVLFLTEQMRQKEDLVYQGLIHRAKFCSLTQEDVDLLNTKTKASLLENKMRLPEFAIRPINEDRHDFNRLAIERFAIERKQKVWMFAASHDRPQGSVKSTCISIGSMLNHGDGGQFKGPGIFFYTPGMPVMLLENLFTAAKLVNGRTGITIDVVLDPKADIFDLNDRYVLCTLPPACLLVQFNEPTGLTFEGLQSFIQPFFSRKYSGSIKDLLSSREVKVRRCQIPLTPAYAITDYKSQGQTWTELELDLGFNQRKFVSDHYKWTSLNVQLGRLRGLNGLCLRNPLTLADVRFKPDLRLLHELTRLEALAEKTQGRWLAELSGVFH